MPLLLLVVPALLLLAGCAPFAAPAPVPEGGTAYALENGRVWNGERFEARTLYVAGGAFSARRPARVDSVVDLAGGYVVPPFGDAHAHHFESEPMIARINEMYLRDGIFYGMSLTNWTRRKADVLPFLRRTETIDVAFSDAGITGTRGHPIVVYESLARGRYDFNPDSVRGWRERRGEGDAYFIADTEAQLDSIWPRVVASRPEIIKIFLLNSENYAALLADTMRIGHTGLNPALVPAIVRRAHADGLRVAAHVNSAADFRTAMAAGVDVMAHMPGGIVAEGDDPAGQRLTEADAREAARRGVIVIAGPLVILDGYYQGRDTTARNVARDVQIQNLRVLREAGVKVAVGSDVYGSSSRPEAAYMAGLGVFTPAEMLRMWSETTPLTIFPSRRIGRLQAGYEASLLVLACDPLARWECTGDVRMRIKQGQRIDLPPPPPAN